jgi:hypothetical protein
MLELEFQVLDNFKLGIYLQVQIHVSKISIPRFEVHFIVPIWKEPWRSMELSQPR